MTYILKAASNSDKTWLYNLRKTVYRDLFLSTWGCWDEDRHARHFSASWESKNISLIEINGERLGMLQILDLNNQIEIEEIQIHPNHQGKGIASQIINDILKKAHCSHKIVTLSTGLKNLGALKLYLRLGFVETKRTEEKVYLQHIPVK